MGTGLEDYEIYVQFEAFPCNIVAAHPCNNTVTGGMSQNEARAALAGYLFSQRNNLSNYIFPFFASQIKSLEMSLQIYSNETIDFLGEIANRGYHLPESFDPIILGYKPGDEKHSLRNIIPFGGSYNIDFELGLYFNMRIFEKRRE